MFITYRHLEMRLDPRLEHSPAQLWTAVEQDIQWPWFYLQVARRDRREVIASTLLLQHAHDLASIIESQSKHAWVEQVQIVTPAHLNGHSRWLMEPLKEVCVVKDKAGVTGLLFKVENDVRYSLHPTRDLDNLLVIKVLFSAETDLERR
ncbi:hypothetical protein AAER22_18665 [Pseudomonas aeruginosa]|uniref:hypothetical protein n=1 Tax=Pseudomonas TaxID=286 RepID=UPI0002CB860D|nr:MULTISPECIES: hypothetical protein [Pseudomonas]EQL43295.1 hypothetical protein M770_32295 [Pseudomonas aeruginosa VRFPA03]SAJ28576.1 Uncharacterised protein [Enterobacter cloacae]SCY67343.1 Uncharacterised protein [Acinetobacter baumannii]AKF99465.1 hypothetical protein YH69_16075 [Pseudomonas aeruginosa]ALY40154.1 hypothetical protein HW09_04465 [Pseudomonas aeruginosa]